MGVKFLAFFVFCTSVALAYTSKFELESISDALYAHNGVFMYHKSNSPMVKGNGTSTIKIDIVVSKTKLGQPVKADLDLAIVPESVLNQIGYTNGGGSKSVCCDNEAYSKSLCKNLGHLFLPSDNPSLYTTLTSQLNEDNTRIHLRHDVRSTGMHYIVSAMCSQPVQKLVITGSYTLQNPYGYLPVNKMFSLPFNWYLLCGYVIAFVVWVMLCVRYANEIMSVQLIILFVLCAFVFDTFMKYLNAYIVNTHNNPMYFVSFLSVLVDCCARTLTRILTLVVCMGLGVSRATLSTRPIWFVLFGSAYFLIAFWDNYVLEFGESDYNFDQIRLFLISGLDAIAYYWIFHSLMDTMDELEEKQQTLKLAIFKKLRNLLVISVVVASCTLFAFSYFVLSDYASKIWKYHWFINDGIWGIFYFLLFVSIMIMWKPNEHTYAIAYHMQLATDARDNDEEYGLPHEELQASDDETVPVEVKSVSEDLKPMVMSGQSNS